MKFKIQNYFQFWIISALIIIEIMTITNVYWYNNIKYEYVLKFLSPFESTKDLEAYNFNVKRISIL